ncbi:MAG: TIM barrel protein [Clostridia bacterium]|nr:TIM barrel protein [Clostridia bacterium]
MLKLSPCIEMLFGEIPDFYDRFAAAKAAGAEYAEFWNWTGKDLPRIKALAEENGLSIGAFCVNGSDPVFNEKRLMYREAIPAFVSACRESVEKAKFLSCPTLIVTCGNERNDIPRAEQHTNIVLALRAAAPVFEESGVTLVLEPLNVLVNHRGYYLDSSYEAFAIVEEVGSPAVKLLFDVYHQQISSGNLIDTIRKFGHLVGHYHVADVPGRHEPGTGEIAYERVFRAVEETGYDRLVGLEYRSLAPSAESFKAVKALAE